MNSLVYQFFLILCFLCFIHGQVGYYLYQNQQPFPFIPLPNYQNHVPVPMALSAPSVQPQQASLINHESVIKHWTPTPRAAPQASNGEGCLAFKSYASGHRQLPESSEKQGKSNKPAKLDYGSCPELEPKENDKKMEEEKIKECLKDLELNENSTLDEVTTAQKTKIDHCILRKQELVSFNFVLEFL